jgi:hypothetical protein
MNDETKEEKQTYSQQAAAEESLRRSGLILYTSESGLIE